MSFSKLYGQESCTQKLKEAEKLYEMGQIDKVASLLEPCLENGFSKSERVKAYRLLTLSHLYYNEDEKAVNTMQKLLKTDAEYKIRESDPSEFIMLHKTFRTTPVFIAGLKLGVGNTKFYNLDNYNDGNGEKMNGGGYTPKFLYSGGLSFETPIIRDLSLAYEFYYSAYSYSYKNRVLGYSEISYEETSSSIDIPIMLQWNILKKDFVPYINFGGSLNMLLSSKMSFKRRDNKGDQYREPINSDFDLTHLRNQFNFSFCGGVGFRLKNVIGRGYLTFDIHYTRYFRTMTSSVNRVDNSEMIYSYLTAGSTLKVQNTVFLLGYKVPIYIAKRKRKIKK